MTNDRTTATVVVPSFREDPDVLVRCLKAWAATDEAPGRGGRGPGSWSVPTARGASRSPHPASTGAGRVPTPSRPATQRPRSFADLRTGALEGRTFASLQEFAVAAVLKGGYSESTIARLFRIQHWRLQQWVHEAAQSPRTGRKE